MTKPTLLITSAAYADESICVELGRLPPAFLPIGNKRLYVHQIESIKHLLDVQSTNDFETHLKHERTLIEASGQTAAFKEGVSAFLEKREAKFD